MRPIFRPTVTRLESRDNPASAFTAFGAAPGGLPLVDLVRPDGSTVARIQPYDAAFRGGVRAAAGELDGDPNTVEVVTAPGAGGGPHVRVYRVDTTSGAVSLAAEEFVYDAAFTGGVLVAVGDVTAAGDRQQVIVGPGEGGGPRVRVLRLDGGTLTPAGGPLNDFFAYEGSFRVGVRVAAGELNGDPTDGEELVVAAGPGGGPRVRVLRSDGAELANYFAFRPDFLGGVNLGTEGAGVGDRVRLDALNLDFSQRLNSLNQSAALVQPVPDAASLTGPVANPTNGLVTDANGFVTGTSGFNTNGLVTNANGFNPNAIGGTVVDTGGFVNTGFGTAINNTGFGTTAINNTGFGPAGFTNAGFGTPGFTNTGFGTATNNSGFGASVIGTTGLGGAGAVVGGGATNGTIGGITSPGFTNTGFTNTGIVTTGFPTTGGFPVTTTTPTNNFPAATGNPNQAAVVGANGVTALGFGSFGDPGAGFAFPPLLSPAFVGGGFIR